MEKGKRILLLCTGNSCRSQMAKGFLKSLDSKLIVRSAGTEPAGTVHPKAIQVMKEIDIDISKYVPKNVNEYVNQSFDFVITVCDNAKQSCPVFTGVVNKRLHIGFEDPAEAIGEEEQILNEFRDVRDKIKSELHKFYTENIKNKST